MRAQDGSEKRAMVPKPHIHAPNLRRQNTHGLTVLSTMSAYFDLLTPVRFIPACVLVMYTTHFASEFVTALPSLTVVSHACSTMRLSIADIHGLRLHRCKKSRRQGGPMTCYEILT